MPKTRYLLLLAISVIFLYSDWNLFYYGKNYFNYNDRIICNIKPFYWGVENLEYGFGFKDENGFSLIHKNSKVKDVIINKIKEYSITKDSLIILVDDSLGVESFIICTSDKMPRFENQIMFSCQKHIDNKHDYKWISIDNNKIPFYYEKLQFACIVIFILALFFEIKKLICPVSRNLSN